MYSKKPTQDEIKYITNKTGPKPDVRKKISTKPKTRPIKSNNQRRV